VEGAEEKKPKEVVELEKLIAALEKLPAYENNIDYRMGQLYQQVNRYWEAVEFFDAVYGKEQNTDLGHRSVADVVSILLENLDEVDEAKQRGFAHLATYTNGISPRQITYTFTVHFQKNKEWANIKELLPYLDNLGATNDTDILRFDAELYFMQAVAELMLYNYEGSEKGFKHLLDAYSGSHQEANALYWYSMSMLFQQKYAEALDGFEKYIADYSEGDWLDEAYFQGGICLFGQEKYIDASNRFSYVIDNFPESGVYPNACSMRGDLSGAAGELELAIIDYKNAAKAAAVLKNVKQATYATFQMAEVYEAWAEVFDKAALTQEKYDELIAVVQSYLETWEGEADVAKALFWLGKTMILSDRVEEAVETYLGAIVDYGGDVLQDGVDMMITELVKVSRIWLGVEAQGQLMDDIQAALDEAEDPVLNLRLRVLMAKLDNTEIELGKRLIVELPDLDDASPPVLAAICDASFDMEDYSRAKELLTIFTSRFEESDYVRAAYKLQAFAQYAEGDFDGALNTIDEVQGFYGHDRDVVWAQLMMARILLAQGKFEESRAANMYVLSVREWRGEPIAEATFQMGQVEEKAGNLRKAFGFYQRTYVQYKGHAGGYWAAESYLASARCLETLGLEDELMLTYEAMLYDRFVSLLPQADVAREALDAGKVSEIKNFVSAGGKTNLMIAVDTGGMIDTTLTNTNTTESVETDMEVSQVTETNSITTAAEPPEVNEQSSEEVTETVGMESE
jgi:TolA-binding protein